MKPTVRTAALSAMFTLLVALSFSSGAVLAASGVEKPKPAPGSPSTVSPDANPIPLCPPGDPNGCGIYDN